MNISAILGTDVFWDKLGEDPRALARAVCEIDLVNLEETLRQQPALRAWIATAYETARVEEARHEMVLTKARAHALLAAREEADPYTGKPKTVDVLKAEADADPEVTKATEALLNARKVQAALRGINAGLEDRMHMLQQISANQRAEFRDQ